VGVVVVTIRRCRLAFLAALILPLALSVGTGVASAAPSLTWEPSAQQFWNVNATAILSTFHNGQCTQWAAQKRSDIVQRSVIEMVSQELAHNQPEFSGNWSARYWATNAAAAGIPTGAAPKPGAIAVFQPGVDGAGNQGHVGYVQRILRNGTVILTEMNAPTAWKVSTHRLSRSQAQRPGITYIYR
jgi:surface antigen